MSQAVKPVPVAVEEAPPRAALGPGRHRRWVREVGWRHLVAVAAVLFALYPVAWVVTASINPTGSLASQQLIPTEPTLRHYRNLVRGEIGGAPVPFLAWVRNTLTIAGVSSFGIVFLSALAAYPFSRLRFRGRRAGLLTLLLVQIFPSSAAAVAVFLLLLNLGNVFPAIGIGEKWGLVLVYIGTGLGLNVWLMKGFFDTIPVSLDESARVDGASEFQIFFQITLPLVTPILAVVGLIAFVGIQNDFILPSAVLKQPDDYTLAVGLWQFVSQRYGARWGPFAAGAMMGGAPIVALWFALQRYVVSGLTQGAVKG